MVGSIKMKESKKKLIMIIVVVAFFGLAGAITFITQSRGDNGLNAFKGQSMWVKCSNPDCGVAYEMDKKEFYEYIRGNRDRQNILKMPALPCNECGEKSVYKAVKCEKCGKVFFVGAAGANDYNDRCPDCGYSNIEELRKRKKEQLVK